MVRRLGRRTGKPQTQSLQHPQGRAEIPDREAQPLESGTHRAPYTTAQAIARAWAEAAPQNLEIRYTARALVAALDQSPGAPHLAVARLLATWRKTLAPNTIYHRTGMLRRIADLIDRELRTDLRGLVKLPRKPPPRAAILTSEEERAMWDAAPAWMKLFLALALDLALRFSEARQIAWKTLDAQHQTVTVRTKGGATKTFPTTPRIRALISIAPTDTENLLDGLAGRKISADAIRAAWARLKKKANLPENLIPHDLRRTAAVRAYQATHDVFAAKALLGHEQLATTALYLRAHEPEALRALEQNWFNPTKAKEPTQ